MNPFKMRPERTGDLFVDWEKFWVKPYNKNEGKSVYKDENHIDEWYRI